MWTEIMIPLAWGLAIFLFGMKVMELALHRWAGSHMQKVLETFTETPFRGLLTGTGVTAILQSSSAITVLTVGLVNAEILSFARTLGIILGTNIGTCLTTELIGLNILHYAIPLFIVSCSVWMVSWLVPKRCFRKQTFAIWHHSMRYFSMAVGGFSLILLGMKVMQMIVPALQNQGLFAWFIEQSQRSLLWGVIAGACLTAIIQSSTATIAMAMGLASAQAIPIDLGIAIIFGANIGTCGTALIASIGGSKAGQAVAWSHVILNVGGALLFFPLIPLLHEMASWLSSSPSGQLAHTQTIFNIASSLIALPICYLKVFQRMSFR